MKKTGKEIEMSQTKSAEFPPTKPLPPIGSQEEQIGDGPWTDHRDDDRKSTTSSRGYDRQGEGKAQPRIVRGFHPESMSDDEMDDDRLPERSISFTMEPPAKTKRKTYDGREITFVTLNTQTDWEWVEKWERAKETGELPGEEQTPLEKREVSDAAPDKKPDSKKEDMKEEKSAPTSPQYPMPYDDEYGIPILDLSSDTDDSSDEETSHRKVKDDRTFMPSVGPPNILQYQRESEKQDIPVEEPESRAEDLEGTGYEKDEAGKIHGMFTGICEFCSQPIKPFPTVEQQLKLPPEVLYCCSDYREFVEFTLATGRNMEEEMKKHSKLIDIKPHEHVGSKQERNAAKEKAVQRMRERELQRRQQEATGMQQSFFASSPVGVGKLMKGVLGGLGGLTMKDMYVARQMKTINYQLSSQKCLEEGWTLRAPSPLFEEMGDDVFIPEPLHPEMIADGQYEIGKAYRPDSDFYKRHLRDRPLIEKFYESGKKFLTMFPDGTGNVFYPSGNLAILISAVKLGQYYYTIHQDSPRSGVAAAFEPNGYGYCYFPNGDIRLYIDQYGGIELDNYGSKRRKWSWKDQVTHVHAPPFQPICIGLNRHMGVRVMSQDNISLTFSASKRSCRFNMGSRLKLVAPENAPLKEIEEEYIFLEEKKSQVDALLNKVANLLKFPNNPKVEKMLPPLHVTSKQHKTEKLKKERQIFLAQQSAREKKQPSITVN